MAGGIKGITVEIGGNTTKLGQAIGDIEKKSRSLQSELRQVGNLLKYDPTNVELLSQKQELLTRNITETSKKLDLLKEAEKQVQNQFEKGEASEDQVRALQREIIKTEQSLDSMNSEVSSTAKALKALTDGTNTAEKHTKEYADAVEKAKKEMDDFKNKASETFDKIKTGAAVAGAALVGLAGYTLKLSTDFDKASNSLIAKTGASTDEIESLNATMEAVYANNFGESIEDVAEAMALVNQNTQYTGEELQKATKDAILFRDTFGFEVEESTRSAKMLMAQFGLSAHEAYNLMAQGAQNGLNKNGDLMDVINEYSVHFAQMGFDAEEMFNTLIAGADGGAFSVDKIGDAFKEFGIRVKDESDATMDALVMLGLDAEDLSSKFAKGGDDAYRAYYAVNKALMALDDPLKQNQIGVALYGSMWEDLGTTVINEMTISRDQFNATIDTMQAINDVKYDDIGSALSGLRRTFETDVINPLGEELTPVVENVIDTIKNNAPEVKTLLSNIVKKIGKFIGYIVNNGATIVSTIGGIGTAFAMWHVVSTIDAVVKSIKAFKLANEGATISQWLLNKAMKANPIGIIISVISGLVAAFVLLWNNCEGFRNFWIGLWEGIKNAFQAFLSWISPSIDIIKEYFGSLWVKIQEIWSAIMLSLQPLFDSIIGAFAEAWELIKAVWDLAKPYFAAVWNAIKAVFSVVKDVLGAYFKVAWEAVKIVWSAAVNYFKTIWNNIKLVFSVVKTYFSGMFKTAWEAIKAVWNGVIGYFKSIWDTIKGIFSVVKNVLSGNWKGAWDAIKGIVDTWKSYFSGVWDNIKKVFSSVKSWFGDTFSAAWDAIKGIFANWGEFFSGLFDNIKSAFSNIKTVGKDIVKGLWNGIKDMTSWVIGKINGFSEDILGGIKKFFGIKSPSRVMRDEVGKMIVKGLAIGIDENKSEVQKVTDEMNNELLASEKKLAQESLRIQAEKDKKQAEKEEKEFQERLKNAKTSGEKYELELERHNKKIEEEQNKYLETLKEIAEAERKLYDARKKDLETAKTNIQTTFQQLTEECFDELEKLEALQTAFANKLTTAHGVFDTVNIGDQENKVLADLDAQISDLTIYNQLLLAIKAKSQNLPDNFFNDILDMSYEDGKLYAMRLLELTDEEFSAYLEDWQRKQELASEMSKMMYNDEVEELKDYIEAKFADANQEFLKIGVDAGVEFETGFLTQLSATVSKAITMISQTLGSLSIGVGGSLSVGTSAVSGFARGGVVRTATLGVFGEDGAEAIVPLENNTEWINNVARQINQSVEPAMNTDTKDVLNKLDGIYERLGRLQMVVDSGALVGEILDDIDSGLANRQLLTTRGV